MLEIFAYVCMGVVFLIMVAVWVSEPEVEFISDDNGIRAKNIMANTPVPRYPYEAIQEVTVDE